MPELPEVEVVVQTLKKQILNQRIIDVHIYYEPIVGNKEKFMTLLNQKIIDITRKGKYLIFHLTKDLIMIGHLRMEGKFYIKNQTEEKEKHEHFSLELENNISVRYHDFRKFGRFSIHKKETYLKEKPLNKLAEDPINLDFKTFHQKLKSRKTNIKNVLLDQTVIAGLGNIYVNETLFLSKIHPLTPANTLSKSQALSILDNSIITLNKAIELGGTTISSYESSLGVHGKFQNELNIHGKQNTPCPVCETTIIKIKVGGRGTYVCPNCQK